jgi:hypothetical protein
MRTQTEPEQIAERAIAQSNRRSGVFRELAQRVDGGIRSRCSGALATIGSR